MPITAQVTQCLTDEDPLSGLFWRRSRAGHSIAGSWCNRENSTRAKYRNVAGGSPSRVTRSHSDKKKNESDLPVLGLATDVGVLQWSKLVSIRGAQKWDNEQPPTNVCAALADSYSC